MDYSDIREIPVAVISSGAISRFINTFSKIFKDKYGNDFQWIVNVINLTAPDFQLLCFRINQCVFSCRIAIIDDDIKYENGSWQFRIVNYDNYCGDSERLRICEENNLVPCVIVLDVKDKQEPAFAIDYGNYLEPFSIYDYVKNHNDKTKLSLYELRMLSRSYILYCLKNNMVLQALSEMPEMQPAMYCSQNDEAIAIIDSIHVNGEKINTYYSDNVYKELSDKGYRILEIAINIVSSGEKSTNDGHINLISRGDAYDIILESMSLIDKHDYTSAGNAHNDIELDKSDMKLKNNNNKSLMGKIKSYFKNR